MCGEVGEGTMCTCKLFGHSINDCSISTLLENLFLRWAPFMSGCNDLLPSMCNVLFSHVVRSGELEVVKFLIEELHCSTECTDNQGCTPLHLACRWVLLVCARWTPLHVAVYLQCQWGLNGHCFQSGVGWAEGYLTVDCTLLFASPTLYGILGMYVLPKNCHIPVREADEWGRARRSLTMHDETVTLSALYALFDYNLNSSVCCLKGRGVEPPSSHQHNSFFIE